MKKDQVQVGNTYTAKVSGGIAPVRITDERWLGDKHIGWKGVNTQTGRAVTIKSAQRLRAAVGGGVANGSPDVAPGGEGAAEVVAVAGSPKPPKSGATKAPAKAKAPAPAKAAKPAKAPKATKPKAPKKTGGSMSGLDAAAKVLADARKPMSTKEIVAEAFKKNLWRSEGATPEATIYAAIIREISAKGGEARFKKVDRGRFAATGKGA